ncbi:MAG: MBL fold metallo-hydrolase [Burkholderiales bacterium]|nr:MBL fold metallo-hydrolase [Burkholderiales bacterium]
MDMEVTDAIEFGPVRIWPGARSGKYPDGNQVLVRGADVCVAFDTPLVARQHLAELERADLVVLGHVHEDHMVALAHLPRVAVQVHAADLAAAQSWQGLAAHYGYPPDVLDALRVVIERDFDYAPRPDATAYADGSVWELGGGVRVRAHHLPGHTAGHSALVVESEGVAFIGDIDLTGFGPYYGDATSDLDAFECSLARVREIDARVWVTSHHKGVVTERAEFLALLDRYAGKIAERDERLLAWLAEGPQTLAQLAGRHLLYPAGVAWPYVASAERRTAALHLARLARQGRVRQREDQRFALA